MPKLNVQSLASNTGTTTVTLRPGEQVNVADGAIYWSDGTTVYHPTRVQPEPTWNYQPIYGNPQGWRSNGNPLAFDFDVETACALSEDEFNFIKARTEHGVGQPDDAVKLLRHIRWMEEQTRELFG